MTSAIPKNLRRNEAGYTLLLAVFMVATMIVLASAAAPSILTQGRRDKETEMIWRGEQYERAIGMYYKKFGKYPTKVEDLTKQTNGVRFLRKAYTDPMNKDDGSWRFIYVGPSGQLIGSLRPANLLQTTLSTPGLTGLTSLGGGLQPLLPPGATATQQQPGAGAPGQLANNATTGNPLESQPQPLEGAVMGGNIIGVGSKIKKPSLRIYLGGDTYQLWEFVWNPAGQIGAPGQAPVNPNQNPNTNTNPNANPGYAPNGINPNSPDGQQPPQNPQMPNVNLPPAPSPAQ
jgi:type II secretory pathway pseudopilin PulG